MWCIERAWSRDVGVREGLEKLGVGRKCCFGRGGDFTDVTYLPEITPRLMLDRALPGAAVKVAAGAAAAAAADTASCGLAAVASPSCPAKVRSLKRSQDLHFQASQ